MTGKVLQLGLTGYPLEHSLSPKLHAAALEACGLEGDYRLYPVPPGDESGLRELLESVRRGALHGLNVTIPHKRSVLPLLDEVSQTARAIGAVNTIYARDGVLVGENTDNAGFLSDLERWLPTQVQGGTRPAQEPSGIRPTQVQGGIHPTQEQSGSNPVGLVLGSAPTQEQGGTQQAGLVLGSGGSARAVVYALVQAGWQVSVAARRPEQAQDLRWALSRDVEVLELNGEAIGRLVAERQIGLVVNATPLGMGALAAESPWPAGVPLPGIAFVYDLVYNPPETALMRLAREAGLTCANGLGMLIDQARLAFKLWTGCEVEREVMEQAVKV